MKMDAHSKLYALLCFISLGGVGWSLLVKEDRFLAAGWGAASLINGLMSASFLDEDDM